MRPYVKLKKKNSFNYCRNKGEGYFVVSALLKKLCSTQEGLQAVCKLPAFLKRLNSLSEDLERKASMERR